MSASLGYVSTATPATPALPTTPTAPTAPPTPLSALCQTRLACVCVFRVPFVFQMESTMFHCMTQMCSQVCAPTHTHRHTYSYPLGMFGGANTCDIIAAISLGKMLTNVE